MSFSSSVKKELASIELISPCCLHAQIYGLALYAHFSSFDVSLTTENADTRRLYCEGLKEICSVEPQAEEPGAKKVTVSVDAPADREKVLAAFGHSTGEIALRLNRSNLTRDCCIGAFIRGAFLACGTMADPNKNYHLEFVISHKKLSDDLMALLTETSFNPKHINRKGYHIVYFKDSESIEDLLTLMGATNSSLTLMGIKMEKDVKNRVNRMVNFEYSNLSKCSQAANRHVEAIQKIMNSPGGLDALPENLREVARLRLEYSEASLSELGAMFPKPISRSGLNHRLARIEEFAASLDD